VKYRLKFTKFAYLNDIDSRFLNTEAFDVFTFGRPPVSIELLTKVKGLVFNETFESFFNYEDGDLKVRVIHLNHLIAAKDASGRLQDIKKLRGEQS